MLTRSRVEHDAVVAAGLMGRYQEPHRRYHNLAHVDFVLGLVDDLSLGLPDEDAVRVAAWFHDAIYDPTRTDNEQRSADLAARTLHDVDADQAFTQEVVRLVLLTVDHVAHPADRNGAALCDADLAVLAAAADLYDAYAAAVRQEYAHVPDDLFVIGRTAVLRGLLAREQIFVTERGRERLETGARANLDRELARLGGAVRP